MAFPRLWTFVPTGRIACRVRRVVRLAIAIAFTFLLSAETCCAGFTYLTPTPYLSASDSPFPLNGNPTFHLEDFENDPNCMPGPGVICGGGMLDSPGVNLIYGSTAQGSSVDADDGTIDGSGVNGASAIASPVFFTSTTEFWAFEIEFDENVLGYLPTAVGIVLTDGAGARSGITVFDAAGNPMDYGTTEIDLDPLTTADDRFIGVTNPAGIRRLVFGKTFLTGVDNITPPRLDHLQYGLLIPEPGALPLAILAAIVSSIASQMPRQFHCHNGVRKNVLEQNQWQA